MIFIIICSTNIDMDRGSCATFQIASISRDCCPLTPCIQDRLNSERRPALETTPSVASTTNSEIQNLKEIWLVVSQMSFIFISTSREWSNLTHISQRLSRNACYMLQYIYHQHTGCVVWGGVVRAGAGKAGKAASNHCNTMWSQDSVVAMVSELRTKDVGGGRGPPWNPKA